MKWSSHQAMKEMNFMLYSALALPLWAAVFALYFILRRAGLMRESLIAKCAGSFLAVGSAGWALYLRGDHILIPLVFWFFVLCMIADALLELSFVPGMLLFGSAHICLVGWLRGLGGVTPLAMVVWVLVYALTAWLFRRELRTLGKLTVPFCLYAALLTASLALGLALPFTTNWDYWPLAVGVLCFFVSDMVVAKSELSGLDPAWQKPVMALYWGALYLISSVLWV